VLLLLYQSNTYAISEVDLLDTLSTAITIARIRHSKSIIIIIRIIAANTMINRITLLLMIETTIIEISNRIMLKKA